MAGYARYSYCRDIFVQVHAILLYHLFLYVKLVLFVFSMPFSTDSRTIPAQVSADLRILAKALPLSFFVTNSLINSGDLFTGAFLGLMPTRNLQKSLVPTLFAIFSIPLWPALPPPFFTLIVPASMSTSSWITHSFFLGSALFSLSTFFT